MTWLVTGGAGYIGAHVVRALLDAKMQTVVLDNLSTGYAPFVDERALLVRGSILDRQLVEGVLREHNVLGVIHVAGFKYAGVSVHQPLHTYEQNVEGTRVVLAAMQAAGVHNLVFSSSAAVYGSPEVQVVTEETPKRPSSPYGESKLVGEWLIRDQALATSNSDTPLRHTSLRYFNVVGSGDPAISDRSPHNLFPLVFDALSAGKTPRINGDDYNTPDGTNVRDYVHVEDVAAAHVVAARKLGDGLGLEPAYNLGSNNGNSVGEIMRAVAHATHIDFTPDVGPRRAGDPDQIVATGELAARDLGWANRHSLNEMVTSAWAAHSTWSAPAASASIPNPERTHE